jgi:hypothetical protein
MATFEEHPAHMRGSGVKATPKVWMEVMRGTKRQDAMRSNNLFPRLIVLGRDYNAVASLPNDAYWLDIPLVRGTTILSLRIEDSDWIVLLCDHHSSGAVGWKVSLGMVSVSPFQHPPTTTRYFKYTRSWPCGFSLEGHSFVSQQARDQFTLVDPIFESRLTGRIFARQNSSLRLRAHRQMENLPANLLQAKVWNRHAIGVPLPWHKNQKHTTQTTNDENDANLWSQELFVLRAVNKKSQRWKLL